MRGHGGMTTDGDSYRRCKVAYAHITSSLFSKKAVSGDEVHGQSAASGAAALSASACKTTLKQKAAAKGVAGEGVKYGKSAVSFDVLPFD